MDDLAPIGHLNVSHAPVEVPPAPGLIDEVETRIMQIGGEYQPRGEQISFLPLRHEFPPGMYVRQIQMPKGAVITTRIHRTEHPFVISSGRCLVLVEGTRWEEFKAPYLGRTLPGTRRLLFIVEDAIWTTFHLNPDELRDLEEIELMLTVDYENPLLEAGELPKLSVSAQKVLDELKVYIER